MDAMIAEVERRYDLERCQGLSDAKRLLRFVTLLPDGEGKGPQDDGLLEGENERRTEGET